MISFGIPSAIVGFGIWAIQRMINKSDERAALREQAWREYQFHQLQSSCASLKLGIATAEAVSGRRNNGNVTAALEEAEAVKKEQDRFIQQQSIKSVT